MKFSQQNLIFFQWKVKNKLSFSGDRISINVDLLLLHEVGRQLNLLSSVSNCINDERDQLYIDNSVKALLTQQVFQIAASYEDCSDCNDQREDIIFKMCVGRKPSASHVL